MTIAADRCRDRIIMPREHRRMRLLQVPKHCSDELMQRCRLSKEISSWARGGGNPVPSSDARLANISPATTQEDRIPRQFARREGVKCLARDRSVVHGRIVPSRRGIVDIELALQVDLSAYSQERLEAIKMLWAFAPRIEKITSTLENLRHLRVRNQHSC